jgi:long-subunit acyl-CoA synthetase (AMP-forming)
MATIDRQIQDHPTLHCATLAEAFQWTAAQRPDAVALRTPDGATEITWAEYADRVERLAGGLASLGIGPGDTVAIMLLNRPEFHLVDTAALHLGAVPFSIYNTSPREQAEYVLSNAGARVLVTQREFLPVVDGLVEHILTLEDLPALEERTPSDFHFDQAWRAVAPEDVLTLIYTSGTTGPPKGVELTHANMLAELRGCSTVLPARPYGRGLSFLPAAHIADRWASHYTCSIAFGFTLTSVPDPRTVAQHLPAVRPTAWGAVPRVWEKMEAALRKNGITDPASLPEEVKAGLRAKLGLDEVAWLVSGAAPIATETLGFFADLGLPIQELWGMSETSCCVCINPRDDIRVGSCGPAIPGARIRLADDGELLVRGELVMRGYRNDPVRTAEAIDADGWLHTGDVATIDGDGYMTIVDRKKELIINSAGKNMSPANIERRLKASHALIGQAVVIGDRRPFNVALLVLDPDVAAAYAAEHGLEDGSPAAMAGHPAVREAVAAAVEAANSHLSRVEQIKRFALLAQEWQPGGDELTPTMKLRRRPIAEKYAAEIEALYAGAEED